MFAQCFLELKSTPYHDIQKLTVSDVIGLTQTTAWQNADKQSLEQQRFEAILATISGAANSITKTLSNACTAVVKTLAGR
jgi:hypothetical protein